MKIQLKLFATLTAYLPPEARRAGAAELELEPGTTVGALIGRRGLPRPLCTMVLVNGVFLATAELDARVLEEGDVLAIWPPVGGG
jgi:sulfur carrier protein ThiS